MHYLEKSHFLEFLSRKILKKVEVDRHRKNEGQSGILNSTVFWVINLYGNESRILKPASKY